MPGITYVIVIAVENYNEFPDFPRVDFAKKDAEDLVEAFKNLGYAEEDFIVLINEKATKTAIIQKLKKVSERALENDRIIFYFAGHGFYEGGNNLIAPVDAIKTAKSDTCVSINVILGYLRKSVSKKKILFLDCCHSGFEAGEYIRDTEDTFMVDDLIYQFRKEEFCIGFASCRADQTSFSHPKLQNGVWSHYLVKALSGEASGIYNKGLLFSDKLQSYLKKQTTEFVTMNTVPKKEQTPIKFGSETDRFIIADINPIFEEKERSRKVSDLSFTNISMLSEESGDVNNLPGFQKGFHKVPTYLGSSPNVFIKEKGSKIIEKEISTLSESLKTKLKYKRNEIRPSTDIGSGSIETPDFDYSIYIEQSKSDPAEFILTRKLENFKNIEVLTTVEFNNVFAHHFDNLVFYLSRRISVIKLIDALEALDADSPIKVDYNPADLTVCQILIEGLNYDVVISSDSLRIVTSYQTSPERLVTAFKETHKAILSYPELKMLE